MREYVVNLFEFARTGMIVEGDVPVQELPRMLTEVPAAVPVTERSTVVFHWRAQGFEHSEHRADGGVAMRQYLRLAVAGDMWLECQRCMTPYRHPMATETVFEVVRDEAQADACLTDDTLPEAIIGAVNFDLIELVEEELLLALPLVPKHDVCPEVHASLVTGADGQAEQMPEEVQDKPSPFAALAALKRVPGSGGK